VITVSPKSSLCVHGKSFPSHLERWTNELSSYEFGFSKENLPKRFVFQHKEKRNISILFFFFFKKQRNTWKEFQEIFKIIELPTELIVFM